MLFLGISKYLNYNNLQFYFLSQTDSKIASKLSESDITDIRRKQGVKEMPILAHLI